MHTVLPVIPTPHPPKPSPSHDVEEAKPRMCACKCSGCGCATLRHRLCNGWSGVLFGLLLSGGLLAAIYFATSMIKVDECTSIKQCGELFTDKYVCTTPQCSTMPPYSLAELQDIVARRAYRKVVANVSWHQNLTIEVNDHHDFACTKNATGDSIYLAAEKAALSCIGEKIDSTDTSAEYIVAAETALLYAAEWCAVDDAKTDYCNTDTCTCKPNTPSAQNGTCARGVLADAWGRYTSTDRSPLNLHQMATC